MIETRRHEPIVYRVYEYLKSYVGEENAIQARDLAAQFKISERDLRDIIRAIRNSTELEKTIGSSAKGYFICRDKDEFAKSNETLYATAFNLLRTARANERKAGLEGQGKLRIGEFYKEFYEPFMKAD